MLFTPGIAVGALSGSVGGTVASRNRFGSYFRTRAVPVTSTTSFAMEQKARFGNISSQWQARTDAERAAWRSWAQENPVLNRLGQKVILTGHNAYVQINARIAQAGGTQITEPPISPAPASLLTIVLSLDEGIGNFDITFTATPLSATERLWLTAAAVDSAGINYVQNLLKTISITDLAQASPYDFEADLELRFGSVQVGQKIIVFAHVFDEATGLLSSPLRAEGLVTTT